MRRMQVVRVVAAVLLTVCCVNATVFFREEFADGGKFVHLQPQPAVLPPTGLPFCNYVLS